MQEQSSIHARINALEEELMDRQRELAILRTQLPMEPVANHVFATEQGSLALADAFGNRDDLIVIHYMGVECSYCTMWADGINGLLVHLQDRASLALVSPDAPRIQRAHAAQRGWKFTLLSDTDSAFALAMGFIRVQDGTEQLWPGFSTFWRDSHGQVSRVASATFGPGDLFCPTWHLIDLLKGGAQNWEPKLEYVRGCNC